MPKLLYAEITDRILTLARSNAEAKLQEFEDSGATYGFGARARKRLRQSLVESFGTDLLSRFLRQDAEVCRLLQIDPAEQCDVPDPDPDSIINDNSSGAISTPPASARIQTHEEFFAESFWPQARRGVVEWVN